MEGVDKGSKSYFVMKYQNDTQGVTKLVTQDGPTWVESKLERKTDQIKSFQHTNLCILIFVTMIVLSINRN